MTPVKLLFEERIPAGDGLFRYEVVEPGIDRYDQPLPAVGDLVIAGGRGFAVVARQWTYPDYGSRNWPRYGVPGSGLALLTVVVEADPGLYANEDMSEEEGEGEES